MQVFVTHYCSPTLLISWLIVIFFVGNSLSSRFLWSNVQFASAGGEVNAECVLVALSQFVA